MKTTHNGRTYEIPAGLSIRHSEHADLSGSVACDDCRAWADLGESLRHGKRCDTRSLQAVEVTTVSAAPVAQPADRSRRDSRANLVRDARNGAAGLHSDSDLHTAIACGVISASEAMNRDF